MAYNDSIVLCLWMQYHGTSWLGGGEGCGGGGGWHFFLELTSSLLVEKCLKLNSWNSSFQKIWDFLSLGSFFLWSGYFRSLKYIKALYWKSTNLLYNYVLMKTTTEITPSDKVQFHKNPRYSHRTNPNIINIFFSQSLQ